jgi:hypothetical protein
MVVRLKTTTSSPAGAKARQRILPTWPVPPRITIFIVVNPHSPTLLCVNHYGQQSSAPRCVVPGGTTHLIRRSVFERAIRKQVLPAAAKLDALAVARVGRSRQNTRSRTTTNYSFATLPPQLKIFAFVPAASASLMLPARL